MYRSVFQNSRIALVFAGMTLFSAASMIGTSDDGGMLTDTIDRLGTYRGALAGPSEGAAGGQGGQAEAEAPVFGDYQSDQVPAMPDAAATAAVTQPEDPMSAPLSSAPTLAEQDATVTGGMPEAGPEPVDAPQ